MSKQDYQETPLEQLSDAQIQEFLTEMGHPITAENITNIQNKFAEKRKRKKVWHFKQLPRRRKAVLLVAALLVLIPTSVFAASKIWDMFMTKNHYEATLTVDTDGQVHDNKFYQLELGYLPETMSEIQPGSLKYDYQDQKKTGGFSFTLWKLGGQAEFSVLNVKNYTATTFGDHPSWVIQEVEQHHAFTRKIFMAFEAEGYMLEVDAAKTISDEVLEKVLTNVSLQEVGEDSASPFIDYNSYQQELKREPKAAQKVLPLPSDSEQIIGMGEPVSLQLVGADGAKAIDISFDKVAYLDAVPAIELESSQLALLKEDNLIDAQGNFLEYEATTYERGNGKTTTEKKIKQEKTRLKFVYLTVTIENKEETTWSEPYFSPHLSVLEQSNDSWRYSDSERVTQPFGATSYELAYLDQHGEGKSYYKLADLKPHERRTLRLGYFVAATDLESLFMDVVTTGHSTEVEDLNAPDRFWLDLRQPN